MKNYNYLKFKTHARLANLAKSVSKDLFEKEFGKRCELLPNSLIFFNNCYILTQICSEKLD